MGISPSTLPCRFQVLAGGLRRGGRAFWWVVVGHKVMAARKRIAKRRSWSSCSRRFWMPGPMLRAQQC